MMKFAATLCVVGAVILICSILGMVFDAIPGLILARAIIVAIIAIAVGSALALPHLMRGK